MMQIDKMIQTGNSNTMIQWYKKKHNGQFSVKQSAQYYKNEEVMMQHLVKQAPNLYVAITIPAWQTSHPGMVSNNPSILQDGLGPNCGSRVGLDGHSPIWCVSKDGECLDLLGRLYMEGLLGPGGSMIRNKD